METPVLNTPLQVLDNILALNLNINSYSEHAFASFGQHLGFEFGHYALVGQKEAHR